MSDLLKHSVASDDNMRPVAVAVQDGRLIGTPLEWYPRLTAATPELLAKVELSTFGLHWEELDEDLAIEGMLLGIRPKPTEPQHG